MTERAAEGPLYNVVCLLCKAKSLWSLIALRIKGYTCVDGCDSEHFYLDGVAEPIGEGFMCQVQCKGCLANHRWSQLALNNQGFVCDWQKCGCTDYRIMGIETPKEPPMEEVKKGIVDLPGTVSVACPICELKQSVSSYFANFDKWTCYSCGYSPDRKKEPVAKDVPARRSTAMLDLVKLTPRELIDLIHILLRDRQT